MSMADALARADGALRAQRLVAELQAGTDRQAVARAICNLLSADGMLFAPTARLEGFSAELVKLLGAPR